MHYPKSLVIKYSDEEATGPTVAQMIDASQKAIDHPDVQTIFFVGFTPSNLDEQGKRELQKVMNMVQSWQAWTSAVCEGKVQLQIEKKELSGADDGQFARSTYRTQIFDYILRHAPW